MSDQLHSKCKGIKFKDNELQILTEKHKNHVWININEVKDSDSQIEILTTLYNFIDGVSQRMEDFSPNNGVKTRIKDRKPGSLLDLLSRDQEVVTNTEFDIIKSLDLKGNVVYNAPNDESIYIPKSNIDEEEGFETYLGFEEEEPIESIYDRKGRKKAERNNFKGKADENVQIVEKINDNNTIQKETLKNIKVGNESSESIKIRMPKKYIQRKLIEQIIISSKNNIKNYLKYVNEFEGENISNLIEKPMFYFNRFKIRNILYIPADQLKRALSYIKKSMNGIKYLEEIRTRNISKEKIRNQEYIKGKSNLCELENKNIERLENLKLKELCVEKETNKSELNNIDFRIINQRNVFKITNELNNLKDNILEKSTPTVQQKTDANSLIKNSNTSLKIPENTKPKKPSQSSSKNSKQKKSNMASQKNKDHTKNLPKRISDKELLKNDEFIEIDEMRCKLPFPFSDSDE